MQSSGEKEIVCSLLCFCGLRHIVFAQQMYIEGGRDNLYLENWTEIVPQAGTTLDVSQISTRAIEES
jgi:hypothetical protein